jgi:hypothetical protein
LAAFFFGAAFFSPPASAVSALAFVARFFGAFSAAGAASAASVFLAAFFDFLFSGWSTTG